jgi:photosystem II stability/assembly factor-like uncharacterized protein
MKKVFSGIFIFFLAACSTFPGLNTAETALPMVTETMTPFDTPTVFNTATFTPVAITETPGPPTLTPRPTPTERVNTPLRPGKGLILTHIQMFDAQNGWAFDSENHILRTDNGGIWWNDVTPPTGYYIHEGFFALDPDTAWATFSFGLYLNPVTAYVWRTDDGGETWTPSEEFHLDLDQTGEQYSSEFYLPQGMQFIDRQTGWLIAAVSYNMNTARPLFFHTTDGGKTWTTINSRIGLPDSCVSVGFVFINSQTGWEGGNCFVQGVLVTPMQSIVNDGGWSIGKTLDGGSTYEQRTIIPLPVELQQPEIQAVEGNCGEIRFVPVADDVIGVEWGCVLFSRLTPDYQYFSLSSDGGQTWTTWRSAGNEFFLNGQMGWRMLPSGEIQQTIAGGANWTTIKNVTWEKAQFSFVDEKEGWVLSTRGQTIVLLHTMDGGKVWSKINPIIAK